MCWSKIKRSLIINKKNWMNPIRDWWHNHSLPEVAAFELISSTTIRLITIIHTVLYGITSPIYLDTTIAVPGFTFELVCLALSTWKWTSQSQLYISLDNIACTEVLHLCRASSTFIMFMFIVTISSPHFRLQCWNYNLPVAASVVTSAMYNW